MTISPANLENQVKVDQNRLVSAYTQYEPLYQKELKLVQSFLRYRADKVRDVSTDGAEYVAAGDNNFQLNHIINK